MTDRESGLIRYWFEFDYEEDSPGWYRGPIACGVTAFDINDARRLLMSAFFKKIEFPTVLKVIENVDVSTIRFPDQAYRSINYAPPVWRGIWYPVQHPIDGRGNYVRDDESA